MPQWTPLNVEESCTMYLDGMWDKSGIHRRVIARASKNTYAVTG